MCVPISVTGRVFVLVSSQVQYPHLDIQVSHDFAMLNTCLRVVGALFPSFQFAWMVPEFRSNMERELDFYQEGQNAARLASLLSSRNDVVVPGVRWDLSSRKLLVMEFVHGVKVRPGASQTRVLCVSCVSCVCVLLCAAWLCDVM